MYCLKFGKSRRKWNSCEILMMIITFYDSFLKWRVRGSETKHEYSKTNFKSRVKYKCAQSKEEIYAKHVHKNVDCAH